MTRIDVKGMWEQLNNPGFNLIEFDGIGIQAGLNRFKVALALSSKVTA